MRAQLPDLVLGYEESGAGRPLLLIHGFPFSRKLWEHQLTGLTDAARTIAPDLRGFGESDAPEGPYTVEQMADDCAGLLDDLGVREPVVVGGLSMGGYIALAFYRRHAGRVAGLILAATKAGADNEAGRAGRDKSAETAKRDGPQAIAEAMLPKLLASTTYGERPEIVAQAKRLMEDATVNGLAGALMAMRDRPDSTTLLPHISQPVLVVHGADDTLIPPSEAEAMYNALPKARLALVPRAGHMVNLEQPASFNAEVRNFIGSL
jgi:pimeloyl-ACP methyl ester carboxylesterase